MTPILQTKELSVSYGKRIVVEGIDLECSKGEIIGLIGPNGAGKSTLLKALSGLIELQTGAVNLFGKPLINTVPRKRAQVLAYLPQERNMHWPLPVRDVIALGRIPHRGPLASLNATDLDAIEEALDDLALKELADRRADQLSGGELARVLMARAFAQTPQILLADEPTAGLDPAQRLRLLDRLTAKAAEGMTIILVLHDLSLALRYCQRLVLLNHGRIFKSGPATTVLDAEALKQVYEVNALIGSIDGIPTITLMHNETCK